MLAAEADVVPPDDFVVARHRHPGGDVRDGGRGEVLDFGQERWRVGAGEVAWRLGQPRDSRVRGMLNVNRPLVAVLRDDARQHFVKRVATFGGTGLKVRAVAGDHGSGLGAVVPHCVQPQFNDGLEVLSPVVELQSASAVQMPSSH
jgi:hypothetical protein